MKREIRGDNRAVVLVVAGIILVGILALILLFNLPSSKLLKSPGASVYSYLAEIASNPSGFTIVVGDMAEPVEIAAASEFAGYFGVTSSRIDSELSLAPGLIIIGNPVVNTLTQQLVASWNFGAGDALVRLYVVAGGYSLVIAGTSAQDTRDAVSILKNYLVYQTQLDRVGVRINSGVIYSLTCSDGTEYNSCSASKPKYCNEGVLIDKCSLCGCTSGSCVGESCQVETPQVIITRSVPALVKGGEATVSLFVDIPAGKTAQNLVITETIPAGMNYVPDSEMPPKLGMSGNTISWIFGSRSTDLTITYSLVPSLSGTFSFGGQWAAKIDGINREGLTGGTSSVVVPGCDECTPGDRDCSGSARRECTLVGGCYKMEIVENCAFGCDLGECLAATCEDSDGGLNIGVSGTTSYAGTSYTDSCGTGTIREYYCGTGGALFSDVGCFECSEGACLKQFECSNGELKEFSCPGGVQTVPWCSCDGNSWNCIPNPEAACTAATTVYSLVNSIATTNNLGGYKLVIGRDALASDSIAAIDIAGKLKITSTIIDDEVGGDKFIVVGGPCVNRKAAELLGVAYPSCGLAIIETIPMDKALLKVSEIANTNHLVVAGWEAADTRRAARAIVRFGDYVANLDVQSVFVGGGAGGINDIAF